MSTTSILLLVAIIAYGICIFAISHKSSQNIAGNAENFFVAGRGTSYIPMLGTLLMSLMSCLVVLGYPAGMYRNGIGYYEGIVGVFCAAGLYLPVCYRLWTLSKKYHYITPTDFFYHRFRSKTFAVVLSCIYVICIIPYISVQFKGVANFMASSSGGQLGYWAVIFIFAVYIAVHTISGGNKSVTNTDAFAGYAGTAVMIILVITFTAHYLDGTTLGEAVKTTLASDNANSLKVTEAYDSFIEVIGLGLSVGACVISWPHFMQRSFMAKSAKVMRFTGMGLALGYVVIMGCCVYFGSFIGPYAFPGLESTEAENIMSLLVTGVGPAVTCMLGIAVFAFGLSTADSFVVTATSLIQNNIVVTDRDKQVKQAKWWIIAMVVAVLIVNYFQPAILTNYAYTFCTPGFAQLTPALFLGLFWKRATKEGALAGLVTGMAFAIYTAFINNPIPSVHVIIWGLVPNTIVFIIVSMLTKPDEESVNDIVIPLKKHFEPSKGQPGFYAAIVLGILIPVVSFLVIPHMGNSFVGPVPAVFIVQELCGCAWALFVWLYYKYRICKADGTELGELDVPEKIVISRK